MSLKVAYSRALIFLFFSLGPIYSYILAQSEYIICHTNALPDLFCFPITRKLNDGKQVPRLLLGQLCGEVQGWNIFVVNNKLLLKNYFMTQQKIKRN